MSTAVRSMALLRRLVGSVTITVVGMAALVLGTDGVALGLVGRADGKGGVIAYVFGPRRLDPVSLDDAADLRPSAALRVMGFGDLGLLGRQAEPWPVLGRLAQWDRADWPSRPVNQRNAS